jgi:hypothetical protein
VYPDDVVPVRKPGTRIRGEEFWIVRGEYDQELFKKWLITKSGHPGVAQALTRVGKTDDDQKRVLYCLANIAIIQWAPSPTRKEIERASIALGHSAALVARVVEQGALQHTAVQLEDSLLSERMQSVKRQLDELLSSDASVGRREHFGLQFWLTHLTSYVHSKTGAWHDAELDLLIRAVWPEAPEIDRWRKHQRHRRRSSARS